nr:MAG TPA: hypothetical protein [Caudoviricetes sp.]
MAELQRIKLQPGDLAGYMNTRKEKPKALDISGGGRYTGPNPIVKHLYGPTSTQTTTQLINDILQGDKNNPANQFEVEIRVNKGVYDASRGDGRFDITVAGIIDGLYTYIHQTDARKVGLEYTHIKIATYDFNFIPIVSGTNIMLLESSDGRPLFRAIVPSDNFTVDSPAYINSMFANARPYDFLEDDNSTMGRYSKPAGRYNERALSSMDFKILVGMAGSPVN